RTRKALRPGRSWSTLRTDGTGKTGNALRPLRTDGTGKTGNALRPLRPDFTLRSLRTNFTLRPLRPFRTRITLQALRAFRSGFALRSGRSRRTRNACRQRWDMNVVRTLSELHAFDHACHVEELVTGAHDHQAGVLDPPREIGRRRRSRQRGIHER